MGCDWTPRCLGAALAWLIDPADPECVALPDRVTDTGGMGRDATQATAAYQPVVLGGPPRRIAFAYRRDQSLVVAHPTDTRSFAVFLAGAPGTLRQSLTAAGVGNTARVLVGVGYDPSEIGPRLNLTHDAAARCLVTTQAGGAAAPSGLLSATSPTLLGLAGGPDGATVYCGEAAAARPAFLAGTLSRVTLFGLGGGLLPGQGLVRAAFAMRRLPTPGEEVRIRRWAADRGAVFPSATRNRLFVVSHSIGAGADSPDCRGWADLLDDLLPPHLRHNFSQAGWTAGDELSDGWPLTVPPLPGVRDIAYVELMTNDMHLAGLSPQQAHDRQAAVCAAHRALGRRVVVGTMLPYRDATLTESQYREARCLVLGNYAAYADAAADHGPAAVGQWAAPLDAVLYSPDRVHLTNAGHADKAPVVAAAVAPQFQ